MADAQFVTSQQTAVSSTNKVLRNTYMLLSMTLVFSAAMAGVANGNQCPLHGLDSTDRGLWFVVRHQQRCETVSGALPSSSHSLESLDSHSVPILNYYMQTAGGTQVVVTALTLTGMIFFSLSGYALMTKKDFSYMAGFLMTGMWVVIGSIVLLFIGGLMGWQISGLHLAISAAIVILMSGFILFDTSRIINGGETNYVMATVSLYLSIYNLFTALLHLLGALGDE